MTTICSMRARSSVVWPCGEEAQPARNAAADARIRMDNCLMFIQHLLDAIHVQHRRNIVVLQQDLLFRDPPVSFAEHELVLGAPEESVTLARARKEDVAHPSGFEAQPVRGRFRRKDAAEDVRSTRHRRRRGRFPRTDAHDAVFQPRAVRVIDVRELGLRVGGGRAVRLPGRHPVFAVLGVEREPIVPALLIEVHRFAMDELDARREAPCFRARVHGYAFPPATPACTRRAHSRYGAWKPISLNMSNFPFTLAAGRMPIAAASWSAPSLSAPMPRA